MYEIVWTHKAEEDYLHTLEFWIAHNKTKSFSIKLMTEVEKVEKHISLFPYAGTLLVLKKKIYKTLILKHFE